MIINLTNNRAKFSNLNPYENVVKPAANSNKSQLDSYE